MEKKRNAVGWHKTLEAWKSSGQTRSEFCRKQNIRVSTFDYWKRKLQDRSSAERGFVKVPLSRNGVEKTAKIQIVIDSRFSVELHAGFELNDLITVLRAIGTASCS